MRGKTFHNLTYIKRMIRKYAQLPANKFDNSNERFLDRFLERHKLPKLS